jgi:hypothetical protein
VQLIGDAYKQGMQTYFASFGQFRSFYAFDGSTYLACRPTNQTQAMGLFALPLLRVAEWHFPTTDSTSLPIDSAERSIINRPLRSSASGAWLITGEFGLRVNE